MTRHIGIFPGTFDPIHPGHVALAAQAQQICGLDEVVFMPEQIPRGKRSVTDVLHRLSLIERMTMCTPGLRAVRLASLQFTVQETLPALRRMFADANMTFLMGSDVAHTLLFRWPDLAMLLREVSLAIGMRGEHREQDVVAIMRQLQHEYSVPVRYTLIRAPEADMASSRLRSGVADVSQLHPDIQIYLQEHPLRKAS